MNSINLVSPQGFTTAVLIADKTNNDNIATMTQVNGEVVSASLEIQSVLGALLIPRMTTAQRTAVGFVPTDGMIAYDTDFKDFFYYRNNAWNVSSGAGTVTSITAGANLTGGTITTTGTIALNPVLTGMTSIAATSSLTVKTAGNITALTIDTGQTATFVGTVGINGNINFNTNSAALGLFSNAAVGAGTGGVYFDAAMGNLHFNGGNTSSIWKFFDTTGLQILYVFNNGSATNSVGISNGALVLQSSNGALAHTVPTSMPGGNYTVTWPAAVATITGQALTSSTAGALSWTNVALNGGNTLGAALTLGTTDSNSLILETAGTPALTVNSSQNATFAGTVTVNSGLVGLANTCSFMANVSTPQANVTGDGTVYTVICDHVTGQLGSNYNNATGVFTAPRTGYYLLTFQLTLVNVGAAHTSLIASITVSSPSMVSQNTYNAFSISEGGVLAISFGNVFFMNSGATATCTAQVSNGAKTVEVYGAANGGTLFTGFQVA